MATSKGPIEADLVITRVFDAPRKLVWNAWTDPGHFMQWYGPKGFTSPVCKIDLRVGGNRLCSMRGPGGQEMWYTGVYREVVPMDRLVYTDSLADAQGNVVPATHYRMPAEWPSETLVTVTFEEHQGKTRLTMRQGGVPAGAMSAGALQGWGSSFDKLDSYLRRQQTKDASRGN